MNNRFIPVRPPFIFVMPKNRFGSAKRINPAMMVQIKIRRVFFLLTDASAVFVMKHLIRFLIRMPLRNKKIRCYKQMQKQEYRVLMNSGLDVCNESKSSSQPFTVGEIMFLNEQLKLKRQYKYRIHARFC